MARLSDNIEAFFREGLQRFSSAMQGVPDRVPVYAQMHEFALTRLRVPPKSFYSDPELLVKGSLQVMAEYGIDVPVLDYDVYNIEAEALGQRIIYPDEGMPDVDRTRPLIRDKGDLCRIRKPDFEKDGRFPAVLAMHRIFRQVTGGMESTLGFCAPFSLAANIRGLEGLLMDIYTDPAFARELFERLTDDVLIPWVQRLQAECPTANVSGSDASASLPIVNLEILREWILPYIVRIRDACGLTVNVPNWVGESCLKNPGEMLDLKLSACPEFVEGQDPDVEKLGPAFYKAYAARKRVPLVLGIGAAFLAHGSPAEIRKRTRHYVEVGGRNGGFALYLCNLGATTPPQNVEAAVQAVMDYGTYA